MSDTSAKAKLEVTIQEMVGGIVIEAVGGLDLTTVNTLEVPLTESVRTTVDATEAVFLTVDLQRVAFIDGAGLSLLVAARKGLALDERSLQILLTPGQQPDRVLRLGRFDTIMALKYDSFNGQRSRFST